MIIYRDVVLSHLYPITSVHFHDGSRDNGRRRTRLHIKDYHFAHDFAGHWRTMSFDLFLRAT